MDRHEQRRRLLYRQLVRGMDLGAFGMKGDRGNVGGTGSGWSGGGSDDCALPHNLYCFEK